MDDGRPMGNQVQPRRGKSRRSRASKSRKDQPGRRKVEMVALHAEAHCGSGRGRRGLRSLFRMGLVALLLLAPILFAATGTFGYTTTLDPPPDSPYWRANAPQAHGDAQRSGTTGVDLVATPPAVRWNVSGFAPFLAGPVMDETNVYVVDRKGVVAAINLTSGDEVWRVDLKQEVRGTPALAYGWLYVATEAKELHALSAQSGTQIHKVKLEGAVRAPPLVTEGRVFIGTDAGVLQVLDATTLDPLWSFATSTTSYANGTVDGEDEKLLKPIRAAPAAYDGKVYLGAWNARAYAFSTHGNIQGHPSSHLWTRTLTDILHAAPTVDRHHDLVLLPTADGRLEAVHRATGSVAWWIDAGDAFTGSVALNETRLVAATTDGRLIGAAPKTGKVEWQRYEPSGFIAAPVLANDAVVTLTANGTLSLLSGADGTTLAAPDGRPYTWRLDDGSHATPAVTRQGIVVVDQGGAVTLVGPRPELKTDLSATLEPVGNLTAGEPLRFRVTVKNHGPDLAPAVTATFYMDGTQVQVERLGRLNASQTSQWTMDGLVLGVGAHKARVVVEPTASTDPDQQDAEAVRDFTLKSADDATTGATPGETDIDAIYGRDITGDGGGEAADGSFADGVRGAWTPLMFPAGLLAVAVGVTLGRYVKGRKSAEA